MSDNDAWNVFQHSSTEQEVLRKKDPSIVSQFEEEYGEDPELAKRFLSDPYKAPEQVQMARDYLNNLTAEKDES